jgi:hypothetical protein
VKLKNQKRDDVIAVVLKAGGSVRREARPIAAGPLGMPRLEMVKAGQVQRFRLVGKIRQSLGEFSEADGQSEKEGATTSAWHEGSMAISARTDGRP